MLSAATHSTKSKKMLASTFQELWDLHQIQRRTAWHSMAWNNHEIILNPYFIAPMDQLVHIRLDPMIFDPRIPRKSTQDPMIFDLHILGKCNKDVATKSLEVEVAPSKDFCHNIALEPRNQLPWPWFAALFVGAGCHGS